MTPTARAACSANGDWRQDPAASTPSTPSAPGWRWQPLRALADPLGRRGCIGVEATPGCGAPGSSLLPQAGAAAPQTDDMAGDALHHACRQFLRWREDLGAGAPARLRLRLPPALLLQPALAARIAGALAATGLPAAALQLRVPAGLALQPGLARRLRRLQALGLGLTLGELGRDGCGLQRLPDWPLAAVGIAGALVAAIDRDSAQQAVLAATLDAARRLGLQTAAEDITTPEQADALARLGCVQGQGRLFCRPLSADALGAWLASQPAPQGATVLPLRPGLRQRRG